MRRDKGSEALARRMDVSLQDDPSQHDTSLAALGHPGPPRRDGESERAYLNPSCALASDTLCADGQSPEGTICEMRFTRARCAVVVSKTVLGRISHVAIKIPPRNWSVHTVACKCSRENRELHASCGSFMSLSHRFPRAFGRERWRWSRCSREKLRNDDRTRHRDCQTERHRVALLGRTFRAELT